MENNTLGNTNVFKRAWIPESEKPELQTQLHLTAMGP